MVANRLFTDFCLFFQLYKHLFHNIVTEYKVPLKRTRIYSKNTLFAYHDVQFQRPVIVYNFLERSWVSKEDKNLR